jgi:hypothetical protein
MRDGFAFRHERHRALPMDAFAEAGIRCDHRAIHAGELGVAA